MTTLAGDGPQSVANNISAFTVALAGNPNTGKSTLFNRLTGVRQRTGNYPGVTVEKKLGVMKLHRQSVSVIDLPGTYSLAATSADERVVVDVLSGHLTGQPRPDVVVCVVDATNLLRHLFLASQIAETGLPVVIALNMMDAAGEQGLVIDIPLLRQRLGVPIVETVAARGEGIDELKHAIAESHRNRAALSPVPWPAVVTESLEHIRTSMPAGMAASLTQAELIRLLFDEDSAIADRIRWFPAQRIHHIGFARQHLRERGFDPSSAEAMIRYGHLARLTDNIVTRPLQPRATTSESIDAVLTHRVWGLIVFVLMMFAVFWSIYRGAEPITNLIGAVFSAFGSWVGGLLADMPVLQSLIVDGVIAGVGAVAGFLPQILILFFFIALLEDSGYMARAAHLMDKLFSWCGLSGRSFVPLLSGYACAIPAVMASRTIDNPKARLATILVTPLMSCSARLPVYVLLIGAFIEPRYGATIAALVLFAMHMVGLMIALPMAWMFNRVIFKTKRTPFVLEMPLYRAPHMRDVVLRMWDKGKDFVTTAGTVIVAVSILIWALSYFPRPASLAGHETAAFTQHIADQRHVDAAEARHLIQTTHELQRQLDAHISGAYLEQSYLGHMGKTVQPIFAPAGFDWKITVGVLGSFPAREVIISTMGILYNLGSDVDEGSDSLKATLRGSHWPDGTPVFTIPVVLAIMIFFALCMQCGATLAVIGREAGWKWSVLTFTYMSILAWIAAVLTYQAGTWIATAA
ncbi:MAG: ferrous iron transport protein B [Phycisphaeraceae bacterium]